MQHKHSAERSCVQIPARYSGWPGHYNNVRCSARLEISFELNLFPRVNKVILLYFSAHTGVISLKGSDHFTTVLGDGDFFKTVHSTAYYATFTIGIPADQNNPKYFHT